MVVLVLTRRSGCCRPLLLHRQLQLLVRRSSSSCIIIISSVIILLFSLLTSSSSSSVTVADAYSLQGKRALITGSSGGIGRGIALALADQGCSVIIHYNVRKELAHSTAKEIDDNSNNNNKNLVAGILQADFRNNQEIYDMIKEIDEIWPDGFDILINNAGLITKLALEDDDDNLSSWYDTIQVNLHAPRLLSHLAVRRMQKKKKTTNGGVIINVSSIHSEKSNEYMSAYAASKSGLDALTRTMAIEYAPYNIRVNSVAPGIVEVERTAETFKDPAILKSWTDRMPIQRLGQPSDVADVVLQLIKNDWVTGSMWQVDGGMMTRSNYPKRERPPKPTTAPDEDDDDHDKSCPK